MIGICDHNSAENLPAVKKTAEREGLGVVGGMEVTTKEEVHILALFGSDEQLFSLQEIVYENLQGTNDEKLYGEQVIVNEHEEVVGFSKKLLIGATDITIDKLVELIHERDGLAIAAHVDREGFGIVGQLGFIPADLALDALELADPVNRSMIPREHRGGVITSSDSHRLETIGNRFTMFMMHELSFEEIRKSLSGDEGRSACI
jgi:predicted metal-dependent phosphoesterase TrpH